MTLMRDIPEVPEVYLKSLMDTVLPAFPPLELDSVYDTLISAGYIVDSNDNGPRWVCLPQDPSAAGQSEGQVFNFLAEITQAIIESHMMLAETNVRFKIAGQTTPLGNRHNTSRPDGFFYVEGEILSSQDSSEASSSRIINEGSSPREATWADIIMPMEFKNTNNLENRIDDYAKVMWSMHHVMRNDARRRFVFGLTCEDTKARLWFNDRSDVVASEEFDVNKDWKTLVRIILAMLLAKPVQLGYDLSIKIVRPFSDHSEPKYDITIHNPDTEKTTIYRTIRIISDVGTDSMIGRGTRVWEVRILDGDTLVGPSYALKDVWVDQDRVLEHINLQKIRTEQPSYSRYFLTPLDYGFAAVDPSEPLVLDNTHQTIRHGINLKPTKKTLHTTTQSMSVWLNGTREKTSISRDSVGCPEDFPNSPWKGYQEYNYLNRHSRQHYRIVFKEIGTPIHDLCKFMDVFIAIQGGWEGLHAMHLSGYVHRDVSSGNILLVPASDSLGERGVIMDLEYAKPIGDTNGPHDVRTGTVAFMATEVAKMEHHRLQTLRETQRPVRSLDDIKSQDEKRQSKALPRSLKSPPPFRHNPLHDMESIWWLCIWMMFYLVPSRSEASGRQLLDAYHQVFCNPDAKKGFFCIPGTFGMRTLHLSKTGFAPHMKGWLENLNDLYMVSYLKYDTLTVVPNTLEIDSETIETSYTIGQRTLKRLQDASKALPKCVTLAQYCRNQADRQPSSESSHRVFDCVLLPAAKKQRIK